MEKAITKIENNTIYAVIEQLQDTLGYIVFSQTDELVDCLVLSTAASIRQDINKDILFALLDSGKIEKIETLNKKIIKELKEKYCK